MENQENATFSLEDNPDDEIVEEEVIDRDEEYEVDDDDEEEEEYDDEDYDDEEYDDEDYEEEEDYDDGYNDDYYDDRLNKVLDEIAEIKRGMQAPSTVVQQPGMVMPPQYVYQPSAPPAGSEVVMYNEISRLRDELAKNQSSLEMQKELSRIKEDMARDQRFTEAQYNAEIKRLQDKIDDLLKNAQSPQSEQLPPAQEPARLEGAKSVDYDKLIAINEAILRTTCDNDARLESEIVQLRKKVEEFPSTEELNRAVSSVKKAAHNAAAANPDLINKLSADISALQSAVQNAGGATAASGSAPAVSVVLRDGSDDVSASELLRQLYDIKSALGSSSAAAVKRTQTLNDLVNDYKKVNFDIHSQAATYKDKLASLFAYAKKLEECEEQDAVDLIVSTNNLIEELASVPVTRSVFADIVSYCSENGDASVSSAMRDSAERYFNISDKLKTASMDEVSDYLPDLIAEKNVLQKNVKLDENEKLLAELKAVLASDDRSEDAVKDLVAKLVTVKAGEVVELKLVPAPKTYKAVHSVSDESIFSKLAELKAAVVDFGESVNKPAEQEVETAPEPVAAPEQISDEDKYKVVLDAIAELEQRLGEVVGTSNISDAIEELRSNYIDITDRLVDITEKVSDTVPPEVTASELSDEERDKLLSDLDYIHGKLDEYDGFISQISEVRNDIINLPVQDYGEQFTSVISEITSQCDKLYEDISNLLIETETNILNRIPEPTVVPDAIADAKAEIIAETQAIRDTLVQVNEAVISLPVSVAVDQLRGDILNLTDQIAVNADADLVDRQKLLEDVAYLREQAETALSQQSQPVSDDNAAATRQLLDDVAYLREQTDTIIAQQAQPASDDNAAVTRQLLDDVTYLREQVELALSDREQVASSETDTDVDSGAEERDRLYSYLDDIAARVEKISALADDVTVARDNTATTLDIITPIADTLNTVASDAVSARDAATSALDALAPIADQLNAILDRLDAEAEDLTQDDVVDTVIADEQSDYIAEDLTEIKEDLNTILDTIPLFPQSDDLVTARDNTFSILDTLTLMPQSDDVIATRDGVASVLDAVNALADSIRRLEEGNGENSALTEDVAAIRAALPEGLAEDLAVVRDNTGAMLDSLATLTQSQEDVRFIRQKLEEEAETPDTSSVSDSLADVMQDLGLILDKLEALENSAVADKQEIVDTVSGIREEIHISELDEKIGAAGIDDETRDTLVGEISEIRERLGEIESTTRNINDVNALALDNIANQLADIQAVFEADIIDLKAQLESGVTVADNGDVATASVGDGLQSVMDELAAIKEKIDAENEYDTVEEILSLREDVKAARIVDQNEVSGELEAIKNELAAISSGNILDEIRALRDEVAAMSGQVGETSAAPTEGEVNLVLNEIVSLRDEVFAFKDEVLSATVAKEEPVEEVVSEGGEEYNDEFNNILDELTDIRAAQGELTASVEELKDAISRRTTLATDADSEAVAANGELNVVLDEIINLKNDVDALNERIPIDSIGAIFEQVDEIRAVLDELVETNPSTASDETELGPVSLEDIRDRLDDIALSTSSVDLVALSDKVDGISATVNELVLGHVADGETVESGAFVGGNAIAETLESLRADMDEVKAAVYGQPVSHDVDGEIAELREELENIRAENEALRQAQNDSVAAELAELRDAVRNMTLSAAPATDDNGDTSYAALIEEIRGLKDQIAEVSVAQPTVAATLDEDVVQAIRDALAEHGTNAPLAEELGDIRDEIAQLRSLTTVTAESGGAAEIAALRNELTELKSSLTASDSMYGLAEDVTAIKADVQTLKDEPDLGVINEILALRDEFQALREEIEDVKRIAGETDKQSDDIILGEVQSLRDQLFAISMANVNDASSGETNYESYNNLILDELASLREQVETAGSSEDLRTVQDELAKLKATIDKREELYDALAERVARLGSDATNNKILDELASLRTELANQRDADLTTLNFMSEMAHLLERQNSYISQTTGSKITDEIESLKAEIASSDAVAEEVAKLREIMIQSGSASDNETILGELADLREELSSEKPSRENELILQEIARLRDEITVLADRDSRAAAAEAESAKSTDDELADSLSALKDQLNEIAEIIEPEKKEPKKTTTTRKKSTGTGKKSTGKSSSGGAKKSGSGTKRTTSTKKTTQKRTTTRTNSSTRSKNTANAETAVTEKPTETQTVESIVIEDVSDFDAKINEQIADLGGSEMTLNPHATETTLSTSDTMDVADRLAQQVANKLVIEQLVEQLGDDGMSEDQVDEILRELPHELTTTALDEQSDRVRKLANRLVLNKLRTRLSGKPDKDGDNN